MTTPQQRSRLAGRIVAAREAKGWSQKFLASAAALDQSVLSRIEAGSRTPSIETLHRLRDALSVSESEWLLWLDILKPNGNGADVA